MSNDLISRNNSLTTQRGQKITPHNADLAIADVSGSMAGPSADGRRRIDCLRDALRPLVGRIHVLAFSDGVFEVDADNVPDPLFGTALHLALARATELEPLLALVISDGEPNSDDACYSEAARLATQCNINTLFIGPKNDLRGRNFMKRLAEIGHGRFQEFDITKQDTKLLGSTVEKLLALPPPAKGTINL